MRKRFTFWLGSSSLTLALCCPYLSGAQNYHSAGAQLVANFTVEQNETVTLKDVLIALRASHGIQFSYKSDIAQDLELKVPASLSEGKDVEVILTKVLERRDLKFKKVKDVYIIYKDAKTGSMQKTSFIRLDEGASVKQAELTVTGTVTDEKGVALPGVTAVLKGTSIGTSTNLDGSFSLSVPDGSGTLVFSFIGYKTKEEPIKNRASVNISLEPDTKALEEVVVVGYGTQKKSDVTGSVASVSSEEIQRVPVTSMAQTLQGRVAGVQVTQASNAPGGGVSIRIRGGNSIKGGNEPLYVVDGYPLYNENGASINPNDIESIDILKDASATAIYGSRGANGVVLITTKRGKAGKSTISFDTYYGVQEVQKKIPLLNAQEYAKLANEAIMNANQYIADPSQHKELRFTPEEIAEMGEGTDWQDEIFRKASVQNYQLTFTGGDEKTRYAISGNYYRQNGIVINSMFERASVRFNFDRNISDKLKIGNNFTVSRIRQNLAPTDADGGSGASTVYSALNFSPTVPVYNPDGTLVMDNVAGGIRIPNPVGIATETVNEDLRTRFLGNIFADYEFFKGLNLRVSLGANASFNKDNDYVPRTILSGLQVGGRASVGSSQFTEWQNTNTLTYNTTFNEKHNLNVLLGFELLQNNYEDVRTNTQNYANDILLYNNIGSAGTTNPGSSNFFSASLVSYFARANYDFGGKYLLTATTRVDGSSKFGAGNKYAVFPSGSVAWRVSEEEFLKDVAYLSELKFRTSYGLSGNQEIGQYQSLAALGVQSYNYGGLLNIGFGPNRIANPDLRWETTAQFDAGVDISLFKNRVSVTADYYVKNTRDLLLDVPLPITSGYSTALKNLGKIRNTGFEFGLNTINIDKSDFRWSTNFNIATTRNEVIDLGDITEFPAGEASGHLQLANSGLVRVGQPIGIFYGLVTDGIFQNEEEIRNSAQKNARPGDRRYKDLDNNGTINANDRTIIGRAQPKFYGGMTNNFSFKGFELSVFLQGVYGNDIFNINRFELESLTGISNQTRDVLDRWTPTNPSNTIPRANAVGNAYQISDRQIEDGSFLRVKNITLSYNLPASVAQAARLTGARVYVAANNYFTFTNYSGYDPEVSRFGQNTLSLGSDYGSYPGSKNITVGVNLTL